MALDDIYRLDFFMSLDGKKNSVAVHYRVTEDFEGSSLAVTEAICEAIEAQFWTTFWQPLASEDLAYVETRCQKIYPERDVIFVSQALRNQLGEVTTPSLNATDAVLIAEYTHFWGPRTRGRIYLPGYPEELVSLGRIQTTPIAALQTAANTFLTNSGTVTGPPAGSLDTICFSPPKPNADPPLEADWAGPIRPVVRARIATQRRRRTQVDLPSEDP